MKEKLIFEAIKYTVLAEEEDLKQIEKGIFFAPELALAYSIGKTIYRDREKIFNQPSNKILWRREINLNNGGPSDIIFEVEYESGETHFFVIELKLRDTVDAYQKDIDKLKVLGLKYTKLFCVLIDTFDKENDLRIRKLEENNFGVLHRISDFLIFKTIQDWYKKDVFCVVGLWKISVGEGVSMEDSAKH